jgi:hypothetical protein
MLRRDRRFRDAPLLTFVFSIMFTEDRHWSLTCARWTHYISSILIIPSDLSFGSQSVLFLLGVPSIMVFILTEQPTYRNIFDNNVPTCEAF